MPGVVFAIVVVPDMLIGIVVFAIVVMPGVLIGIKVFAAVSIFAMFTLSVVVPGVGIDAVLHWRGGLSRIVGGLTAAEPKGNYDQAQTGKKLVRSQHHVASLSRFSETAGVEFSNSPGHAIV